MLRDLVLAARARRHGARYCLGIIRHARAAGLPLSTAFALVEQESGFRNVFGHDGGGWFPGERVTEAKLHAMVAHVHAGGISNGVGLTQLTSLGLILEANADGGAWRPGAQLRVGFKFAAALIKQYGRQGLWHYNGAPAYQRAIDAKATRWHQILTYGK